MHRTDSTADRAIRILLSRTKPAVNDTLNAPAIDIATAEVSMRKVLARSATMIDVDYFGILWNHLAVDASVEVSAVDARSTTEQTESQRVAYVDAAAMAKAFASADHAGKGVGAPRRI